MIFRLTIVFLWLPWLGIFSTQPEVSFPSSDEAMIIDFDGTVQNDGAPRPWRLKPKKGEPRFQLKPSDGPDAGMMLYLESRRASFSLNRDLSVVPSEYSVIRWSWKATELPVGATVTESDKNDQALQVLLGFEGNRVLSYIWDTTAPVGTVADESYRILGLGVSVKVLVVESGQTNLDRWVIVTRDFAADYRRLYGAEPPRLVRIRVQSNSQHTKTTGTGFTGRFHLFKAADPAAGVVPVPSRLIVLGHQPDHCAGETLTLETAGGDKVNVKMGESSWVRIDARPEGDLRWEVDGTPKSTSLRWPEANMVQVRRSTDGTNVEWNCYQAIDDRDAISRAKRGRR